MNSGPAFSQIRMAADSELRYYFSCLMLGDRYTILEAVEKSGKTVEEILKLLK